MSKPQATRANEAQIRQTIERQRLGLGPRFIDRHPIMDAVLGALVLAAGIGSLVALWIAQGAGILPSIIK